MKPRIVFFLLLFYQLSYSQLIVNFTSDKNTGCGRTTITFDAGASSGHTTFEWNFGNGQTNNDNLRPRVTFNPGVYTVTFTASDGQNSLQKTMDIVIHNAPAGSIDFITKNSGCTGDTFSFRAITSAGDAPVSSIQWIYGDGEKGTGESSFHRYVYPNVDRGYPLVLEITDTNNCTFRTYEYISVSGKPDITIVPSSFYVCDSNTVYFNAQITSDAEVREYNWNFGDGTIANVPKPGLHHYSSPGKYKVSLEATDLNGCKNIADTTIEIFDLKAIIDVPDTVCLGDSILLKTIPCDADFYKWVINGNDTLTGESHKIKITGTDPLHLLLHTGNKHCHSFDTALITVSNVQAFFGMDTNWVCTFPHDVQFTDKTPGNVKSYLWDFGDGKTSTEKDPKHTFEKQADIKLEVISNQGCKSKYNSQLSLKRPKPVIMLSDSGGCLPITVSFIPDSSKAISIITKYRWEVLHGSWISEAKNPPLFKYTDPITDTIKLTITDQICGAETAEFIFKAGNKPVADFQCPDTFIITGINHALNISEPSDSIDLYKWQWGEYQSDNKNLSWIPYIDTAYYDVNTLTFVEKKYFPLPGEQVDINLVADFYSCPDTVRKAVIMQGPVAEINDVYITSCNSPTQINMDYKIYDAYKLVYHFEDLKGINDFKDSVLYSNDTTITNIITTTLNPGFYKLTVTAYNLQNKNKHRLTYHNWNCTSENEVKNCTKTDIILPVSETVIASFSTVDTLVCWDHLVRLDASLSENAVMHKWYVSLDNSQPALIYPYLAPALTKNDPYICLANPGLCASDDLYNGYSHQSCPINSPVSPEPDKTNVLFCERGLYDITLVSTAVNGCTDTLKIEDLIRVIKPDATFTSDDARVCKGDEITFRIQDVFEDETITSYTIDFDDGNTAELVSPGNPVKKIYPAGVFHPFIKLKDMKGCENKLSHKTLKSGFWLNDFVVTSDPHALLKTEGISCQGSGLPFLSDSGFISYTWIFGDGNQNTITENQLIHTYSDPGQYPFSLIVADTINCTDTAKQIITIVDIPIFNVLPDTNYQGCPIAILTLEDISGNQHIIDRKWEMKNSSIQADNSVITSPSGLIVMPVIYPGIYDVTLEINSKYCGIYDSTFNGIFRMNGPFMKIAPLKENYCRLDSILFKPDSTTLYNDPVFVQWGFNNVNTSKTLFSENKVSILQFDDPGKYVVTLNYNDTLGCEMTDTSGYNIFKLKADFNVPGPICEVPANIELVNLSTGYDSLSWKMNDHFSNEINYSDTIFDFGKYIVSLEVYDTNGCYDAREHILAANPPPAGIMNKQDTIICIGDTIQIKTHFDQKFQYLWSPSVSMKNFNKYDPYVFPTENTIYTLIVRDTITLCDTKDSVLITVQKIPEISFAYYFLPYGTDTLFNLNNTGPIQIPLGDSILFHSASDQPGVSYLWENDDNLLSCLNCNNPSVWVSKQTVVRVSPADSLACYSNLLKREFELIPVEGQILMPTAFSPNGDQINDIVKVEGPGVEKLIYFRIYNYSGNLLFETTDLSEGWNGTYGGKEQPAGVYFYKIKAKIFNDNREQVKEGMLKLVK